MVLDVFSDFLIVEHKRLPEGWRTELHDLGAMLERRVEELQATLPSDIVPGSPEA